MAHIKKVCAREILDSRGNPTVECDVILDSGHMGRAAVPSGASKRKDEALELRDGKTRYNGKGVQKAVQNVNTVIHLSLKDKDISKLLEIDRLLLDLDGTENKSTLGANAILSVSMAAMKAFASFKNEPLFKVIGRDKAKILPVPFMNILNGGAHADNNLDIQEFMIVPLQFMYFSEALRALAPLVMAAKIKFPVFRM